MAVGLAVAALGAACAKSDQTAVSGTGGSTPPLSSSASSVPAAAGSTPGTPAAPGRATGPAKASAGCASPMPATPTPAQLTIDAGGTTHPYRLYVPASLPTGTPVPLVLDLHGLGEKHDEQALVSGWEQLADTEHLVVLTPRGGDKTPTWNATAAEGNPDTEYLRALIEHIVGAACIDTTRIYAGGISNGGLESSILACKLPERIAAVALVSGIVTPEGCTNSPPKPAIVFWGVRDCVLPYYGGLGPCLVPGGSVPSSKPVTTEPGAIPPVEDSVAAWAARNFCSPTPAVTRPSEHVEKRTYTGCTDGAEVAFYVISNGGHTWPGSKAAALLDKDPDSPKGITTMELDATQQAWQFFQRFQNR